MPVPVAPSRPLPEPGATAVSEPTVRLEYETVHVVNGDAKFALRNIALKVNELIAQGWVPLGGVAFSATALNQFHAAQAMVREVAVPQ